MFEQKRFCGDGAYPTTAEQLRECDQQVGGEDEETAHRANGIITISTCKTAPREWIASHYEFAPHRSPHSFAFLL
jgi:hypothetical protein